MLLAISSPSVGRRSSWPIASYILTVIVQRFVVKAYGETGVCGVLVSPFFAQPLRSLCFRGLEKPKLAWHHLLHRKQRCSEEIVRSLVCSPETKAFVKANRPIQKRRGAQKHSPKVSHHGELLDSR